MHEAIAMFVTLKLLFPTPLEWVLHSDRLKTILLGTNSSVVKIRDEDWLRYADTDRDTAIYVSSVFKPKPVYQGEISGFDPAADGTRAAWLEDGKIVIFDLEKDSLENRIAPRLLEEAFVEFHLDPSGTTVLVLVEIDKEKEDFLIYEWRLINIDKNQWKILESKPSTSPKEFLAWHPNGGGVVLHDRASAILYNVTGSEIIPVRLSVVPTSDVDIESASFSPDGAHLAVCCKDENEQGEIFVYSETDKKVSKLAHLEVMKVNPNNVSWSPLGNLILFRDSSPSEPVMKVISTDGKRIYPLFAVPDEGFDEPIVRWMSDGKHVYWFSENALNIVRFDDALIEK